VRANSMARSDAGTGFLPSDVSIPYVSLSQVYDDAWWLSPAERRV
jgi:hypothetical protein